MLGMPFTSEDAKDSHIADELVSRIHLKTRLKKIAREFGYKNPVNLKAIKLSTISMPDLSYMQGLHLESDSSNYFEWKSPDEEIKKIKEKYSLKFELTGNPEKLIKDSQKHLSL